MTSSIEKTAADDTYGNSCTSSCHHPRLFYGGNTVKWNNKFLSENNRYSNYKTYAPQTVYTCVHPHVIGTH